LGRQNRSSEATDKDGDDRSYIRAIDLPLGKQTDNAAFFRGPVVMMQQFMQGRTDGQCGCGEDQGGQHDRQDRLRGAAQCACSSVKCHEPESTTPNGSPQARIGHELGILKRCPYVRNSAKDVLFLAQRICLRHSPLLCFTGFTPGVAVSTDFATEP